MTSRKQNFTSLVASIGIIIVVVCGVIFLKNLLNAPNDQSSQIRSKTQLLVSDLVFGVTGNDLNSSIFYTKSNISSSQMYADLGKQMNISEKSDVKIVYLASHTSSQTPSVEAVIEVNNYEGGKVTPDGNSIGHSLSGKIVSTNQYEVHIAFLKDHSSFVSTNWNIAEVFTRKLDSSWQETGTEILY